MLAYSMAPSASVQTLVHREPVMLDSAPMDVLVPIQSKCAEGLDISTSSTLMHTKQRLMTGVVETQYRIPTTKNGTMIWVIVMLLVSPETIGL